MFTLSGDHDLIRRAPATSNAGANKRNATPRKLQLATQGRQTAALTIKDDSSVRRTRRRRSSVIEVLPLRNAGLEFDGGRAAKRPKLSIASIDIQRASRERDARNTSKVSLSLRTPELPKENPAQSMFELGIREDAPDQSKSENRRRSGGDAQSDSASVESVE